MATILFCGDPHGRFEHIQNAINELHPDAIVLAGDQMCPAPISSLLSGTEVFWIHGNHDTDSARYYDHLFCTPLSGNSLDGRVLEVAGIRIAGVGGVFRRKLWDWNDDMLSTLDKAQHLARIGRANYWRLGLPLRDRSSVFPSTINTLAEQKADVLVTHEPPNLHPLGKAAFTRLAKRMGCQKAFHGHVHQMRLDYPGNVWCGLSMQGIVAMDTHTFELRIVEPGFDEIHDYQLEEVIHR